jgi:hypothetical protein
MYLRASMGYPPCATVRDRATQAIIMIADTFSQNKLTASDNWLLLATSDAHKKPRVEVIKILTDQWYSKARRSCCPKEQLHPTQPWDPKRLFLEIRHHLPVDPGKPIDELLRPRRCSTKTQRKYESWPGNHTSQRRANKSRATAAAHFARPTVHAGRLRCRSAR